MLVGSGKEVGMKEKHKDTEEARGGNFNYSIFNFLNRIHKRKLLRLSIEMEKNKKY